MLIWSQVGGDNGKVLNGDHPGRLRALDLMVSMLGSECLCFFMIIVN